MADNTTVSSQSGISRLANSICCAVCVAPAMILGATFLLGLNEKIAVCQTRAIESGEGMVKEVGCEKSKDPLGNDALVMFSCPLKDTGLKLGPHWLGYDTVSGIMPLDYVGTGLDIKVEMLQCHESTSSRTEKDSLGGGEKTITTYHYKREWSQTPIDSYYFAKLDSAEFRSNCGRHNPDWPVHVPRSTRLYAPSAKIGEFDLSEGFIEKIPLDKPVELMHFASGWLTVGPGQFQTNAYTVHSSPHSLEIGTMRVTLMGTDWAEPTFTVLGHEKSGILKAWEAPPAWLCSGYHLSALESGHVEKASLFEALQDESDTQLTILRLLGFVVLWCAFAAIAAPIGIVADCIPFVGPYIGDAVDTVTCCISCMPATACCFMVAGAVWVVMRPLIGIPLLLVCAGLWGGLVYAKMKKKGDGGEEKQALTQEAE